LETGEKASNRNASGQIAKSIENERNLFVRWQRLFAPKELWKLASYEVAGEMWNEFLS
jgi:hypothetical protein